MITGRCLCGRTGWRFESTPERATACNCAVCRRHGALWIYGHEGHDVSLQGEVAAYVRSDLPDPGIEFIFCPTCGSTLAWRGMTPRPEGKRLAVNVRMAELSDVGDLPIRHFDGADTWEARPDDGARVRDLWF